MRARTTEGSEVNLSRLLTFFVLSAFAVGPAGAVSITYTGAGADLNTATFDSFGNVIQGATMLSVQGTDPYLVAPGDSVQVTLTGLQYPYAGDLQVNLSLEDSLGNVLMSGDVFNQIGAFNPGDPGYDTQFGNSSSIPAGNYVFDSSFTGDLWNTAAALGSADSIPDGDYWPTTALSNNNDSLSTLFAGLPLNDQWVLTIYDDYPPFDGGIEEFVPSITSWSVTVQAETVAAEPSMAIPAVLCGGLLWVIRRRARTAC
jgi:hypothetical protein